MDQIQRDGDKLWWPGDTPLTKVPLRNEDALRNADGNYNTCFGEYMLITVH